MQADIQFGTDGWRGLIAEDFTFANVRRVTRAIAVHLEATYERSRPVLVGYDTRFLADQFAQCAAEILAELGWMVQLSTRDCPTPAIAYSARQLNSAGALMFTASHNPAPYCGIKYIPDYAGPATPEITQRIVANLSLVNDRPAPRPAPPEVQSRIQAFDPKPRYLQAIYQLLDIDRLRAAKLRVKYDALYSTSRGYLDQALEHCGCQVESFNAYRDVLFGGGMPEPRHEQLGQLAQAVTQDHADAGLATDGDSDRFGVVDEQGTLLSPNQILLLLAQHLLRKGKTGAIVRTVATSHLLDQFAALHGLPLYETPVGFKYIGEKMRQMPVLIGGEESGGLSILGHIPEKDGILANLLVLEAIACSGKPLSQLVHDVVREAGGPFHNQRIDLHLTPSHKQAVLDHFFTAPPTEIAGLAVQQINRKDGLKLLLSDGSWLLLRASGTEPLVRVYAETRQAAIAPILLGEMQRLIRALSGGIG
jgi:phosphomannomutase